MIPLAFLMLTIIIACACITSISAFKCNVIFSKVGKNVYQRQCQYYFHGKAGGKLLKVQNSATDEPTEEGTTTPADEDANDSTATTDRNNKEATTELSPLQIAINKKETELRKSLESLEQTLKLERLRLGRAKDQKSESGKMGYFMIQAQVNDFLRRSEQEQKRKVEEQKRAMVSKMLPVIDMFRSARIRALATNEREESMHTNFGALLDNILNVIKRLGYEEYQSEAGAKYDAHRHEVFKTVPGDADNVILSSVRKGLLDEDKKAIRREQVVISKRTEPALEVAPVEPPSGQEQATVADT